ncbi:protein of unknown function [Candidatus Nitrosocosmicus franklandus]|uniref:Uncharacterized protein n=1 Tax=Candidatus Nitrosocosmicus franklandianus TaxID=1798806 RepID=A0A484IBI3_9ARCH|nr:protein of unknown function [Candidatus Nitrosocosmicus franklandus]
MKLIFAFYMQNDYKLYTIYNHDSPRILNYNIDKLGELRNSYKKIYLNYETYKMSCMNKSMSQSIILIR